MSYYKIIEVQLLCFIVDFSATAATPDG